MSDPMKPPTIGPTGSRVVSHTVTVEQERERVFMAAPSYPQRIVTSYDADGYEIERERTDEELDEAIERYKVAQREWLKTGGVYYTNGCVNHMLDVVCEDGSTGHAIGNGRAWLWQSWTVPLKKVGSRE